MTHQETSPFPQNRRRKRIVIRFMALFVMTIGLALPFITVFADVPGITSSPVTEAVAEQVYNYTVIATGVPAPTFTLTTAPQGMIINEVSGVIEWTPSLAQTGDANVTVLATNVDGTDSQSFTIAVASLPEITSVPGTEAAAGQPYTYTVAATGDPAPTFTLSTSPAGMLIDELSGQITWTPVDATDANVTVNAINAAGSDSQSFAINVSQVPTITSTPVTIGTVNDLYEYAVAANGDPSPTFTLTTAPTGMTIDNVSGLISWTPQAPGVHDVTVEAVNPLGTAAQSFAVTVNAVCPTGMVSYWRLDETSGTVFADYFGTNPASFAGTGSPGYVTGVVDGAVDLPGTNQLLGTANTGNPTSALTLLAWIKPDDLSTRDRGIISKDGAFSLTVESDGDKISFTVGNSTYYEFEPNVPANFIPEKKWTFVAATFDGATKRMRIYINGTEVGNVVGTISSLGNSSTPYVLGWDANFETNRYLDGAIDETAVFNRVLTPAEIQLQYSRTLADQGYCDALDVAPQFVSTPAKTTTAGLLYTYDANASGSPAITYSLLTPPVGMTIDSVTGVVSWIPTTPDDFFIRVRATNVAGFRTQTYTLTVTAVGPQIISTPIENAITGYPYTYDVNATGQPTPTYTLQTPVPVGMTIDEASGVISWPSPVTGSHNVIVIAANSGGSDQQSFTIDVAEPSSVCPANMFSYWRLDETTGTIFADSFGINDATFSGTGSPGFTTGQVKGAVNLNGSNQKLSSANTSNPTNAVTLMAWINPDNFDGTADRGIISKNGAFVLEVETAVGGDGTHNGLSFTIMGDDNDIDNIANDYLEFEPNIPANQIPVGTWTHVAATFDITSKVATIYINGQVISSTALAITIGNPISAYNIGYTQPFDTDRYFDGIIDEAAVFDEALSLSEIQEIYNNSLVGDTYCEIVPKITSQPVTIGEAQKLYTYDVDATGNPAPTYILTNYPAGMTIDANTGIINWTPTSSGTFAVSVQAQNFAGFQQQDFQIIIPDYQLFLPMIIR